MADSKDTSITGNARANFENYEKPAAVIGGILIIVLYTLAKLLEWLDSGGI